MAEDTSTRAYASSPPASTPPCLALVPFHSCALAPRELFVPKESQAGQGGQQGHPAHTSTAPSTPSARTVAARAAAVAAAARPAAPVSFAPIATPNWHRAPSQKLLTECPYFFLNCSPTFLPANSHPHHPHIIIPQTLVLLSRSTRAGLCEDLNGQLFSAPGPLWPWCLLICHRLLRRRPSTAAPAKLWPPAATATPAC